MSTVPMSAWDDARMNRLFACVGKRPPHWKDVIYAARHDSSIIGFQIQQLAQVQAQIPVSPEFEVKPGRWVNACEFEGTADQLLAADIAVKTWGMFRSASGSQQVALKQAAEIYGSVGEGYGIEHSGRSGKPAVSFVHCPAVSVRKDGGLDWRRRSAGDTEVVRRSNYERLFREDETYVDDCTSPWRHLVNDLICFEIVCAALKKAAQSDMLLRGLVWAPAQSKNEEASWLGGYLDMAEKVMRDPDMIAGFVPFPVTEGGSAPEHVSLGDNITDGLIKLHDVFVQKIARASVFPAQLVLEGPGAGNAYADHALNRNFLQHTVMSPLEQYVYPDLAGWWWHPKLAANREFVSTGIDVCRFRLAGDISRIANRPDSRKELIDAKRCGIVFKNHVYAEAFGRAEADMLRPGDPGWQEWLELQLLLKGNEPNESGSPKQVDIGGGVPETDGFALSEPLGPRFGEVPALW